MNITGTSGKKKKKCEMVLQGCRNAHTQLCENEVGSICRKAWGTRPDPKLLACWKSHDFCHFCDNVQFLWTGQTFGSSEKKHQNSYVWCAVQFCHHTNTVTAETSKRELSVKPILGKNLGLVILLIILSVFWASGFYF